MIETPLNENAWAKVTSANIRLAFEIYYVARMRFSRLVAGGYRAEHELRRVRRDRQSLRILSRMRLAQALADGKPHIVPAQLAALYRGVVHENFQRLSER